MRKYRIELIVLGLFFLFLTALMWKPLSASWKPLPYLLMTLWAGAVGTLAGLQVRGSRHLPHEKYAHKEFLKVTLSSLMGLALAIVSITLLRRETFSTQFDLTKDKTNSLKEETLKVLKRVDREVQIYCVPPLRPTSQDFCYENLRLRTLLSQQNHHITHRTLNLQNPEDISLLSSFTNIAYGALVIKSGDYLSEINSPTEAKVTNALLNLTLGEKKKDTYFLVGTSEPGFQTDRENHNYAFLKDQLLTPKHYGAIEHSYLSQGELPPEARVVVVGPSRVAYPKEVVSQLKKILAHGGKLIISMNPYVENSNLEEFLQEIGISYETSQALVTDRSAPIGESLSRLNPVAPVAIGNFSRVSNITSQFPYQSLILAPGARALQAKTAPKDGAIFKHVPLMSSLVADKVTLNNDQRQKLLRNEPTPLSVNQGFDQSKTYHVAYHIEIENPQLLYKDFVDQERLKAQEELIKEIKPNEEVKIKAEIALFGFEIVNQYMKQTDIGPYLPFTAIAHFHNDAELLSFEDQKKSDTGLDLAKNPEGYLFLFAGFLPLTTLLAGLRFALRRRRS